MIIYKLTSPENKCYIGLTKHSLKTRWKQHINHWHQWQKGKEKYESKLYEAFNKFNPSSWTCEIICEANTIEDLAQRERKYIEQNKTIENGYNILTGGIGIGFAERKLSEQHKEKLRQQKLNYWQTEEGQKKKQQLSQHMKKNNPCPQQTATIIEEKRLRIKKMWKEGKFNNRPPISQETRQKLSKIRKQQWKDGVFNKRNNSYCLKNIKKAHEFNKGKHRPESQKQAVRAALSKSFLITFPDGHQKQIIGLNVFCKQYKLDQANMVSVASGRLKHYKGYKVQKLL